MTDYISNFLKQDDDKIEALIRANPESIPTKDVAELLGMSERSVRACLEAGRLGGLSWRKDGSLNKGYRILTAPFVRWYLQCRTPLI